MSNATASSQTWRPTARQRAVLRETVARNPFIPPDRVPFPRQDCFLALECLESLYGGAAGGGKSDALLMAALQYVEVPTYSAILFRQRFTDLNLSGALMDRAKSWLSGSGAKWNGNEYRWRFPSGASLQFGYLETDRDLDRYRSAEFQFVGLDELTQFPEHHYTFLFSRLRRQLTSCVPIRMRGATTPGGIGHAWVRTRFLPPGFHDARHRGLWRMEQLWEHEGRVFVPALRHHNTTTDQSTYTLTLAQTDALTRAQHDEGDWDAVEGGRFRREWFRYYQAHDFAGAVEYELLGSGKRRWRDLGEVWKFQTVDPAASDEHLAKTDDPDWTVISTWGVTPDNELLWLDCHRFRLEIPDIIPQLETQYRKHNVRFVAIEVCGANRAVLQFARKRPMVVREFETLGTKKLVRVTPAMNLMKDARLWLPEKAHWLETAETELLTFKGDGKGHDDICDTAGMAANLMSVDFETSSDGARPMGFRPTGR